MTRNVTDCPISGPHSLINKQILPKTTDVLEHVLFVRNQLRIEKNRKQPAISTVSDIIGRYIVYVWTTVLLPVVTILHAIMVIIDISSAIPNQNQLRTISRSYNNGKTIVASNYLIFVVASVGDFTSCSCP